MEYPPSTCGETAWRTVTTSDTSGGQGYTPPLRVIEFNGVGQYLFSSDLQSALMYNPVYGDELLASFPSSCEIDFPPFHKIAPLSPQATHIGQLPVYAARGNFQEVYRFLGQQAQSAGHALRAGHMALILEREHLGKYRDSVLQLIRVSPLDRESKRMALNMKRIYDRVIPRALMPKSTWDESSLREGNTPYGMPSVDRLAIVNYPNPFGSSSWSGRAATEVAVYVPESTDAHLSVTNALGSQVAVLHSGPLDAGWHSFKFDGGSLPGGLYLAVLKTDVTVVSRRMTLVK